MCAGVYIVYIYQHIGHIRLITLLTNIGDTMSINNVIPHDIVCEDSLDNQLQAFLVAMKDILDTQCRMMVDKDNYVEREKVEKIEGVRFKVISKT